jgi:predicted dehydrogenase
MTSHQAVRVGVIGVGTMGERHTRLYAQLPAARLVGVYDANPARAAAVAAQWGTRAFPTVEGLFGAVDAVSIASSTPTHAVLALAALDRGLHLLIEKPLADNVTDARLLAASAARRPGLCVQVGHIERFNPVVRELRRLLRGERLIGMTLQRLSPFDGRCLDSDVIHDLMIHDLDLARAFGGDELRLVAASGSAVHSPRIDQAVAQFRSAEGARLTLYSSRVAGRKVRAITALTATASIEADLLGKTIVVTPRNGQGDTNGSVHLTVPLEEPLAGEIGAFLGAIQGRERPVVGVEDGLYALQQAAAVESQIVRRSARRSAVATTADSLLAAGF